MATTVELETYQSFTTFWSCKEDGNFKERIHAEMHKLMFDQDMFHCIKLFQGEMMTWKRIPHYSQCQHHMQAACVHNDKSRWASDLASSFSFVPIFTSLHDQNTLQELATIRPELGQDREDKMLAEMLAALYLIYNNDRGSSQIKVVAPVLLSDSDQPSLSEAIGVLSDLPSAATCIKVASELSQMGVGDYARVLEDVKRWSVKQAVTEILQGGNGMGQTETFASHQSIFEEVTVVAHGKGEHDAVMTVSMLMDRLREAFNKYSEDLTNRFSKHTYFGAEMYRLLGEFGLQRDLLDIFAAIRVPAAFSFESLLASGYLTQPFKLMGCCRHEVELSELVYPDVSAVDKLEQSKSKIAKDDRMKTLKDRLYHFKDLEADGILAMMTTNCIETGILKLPTQAAMLGLCGLYCTYGYYQFHLIFTEHRWLFNPDSKTPYIPKTFRWTRVCDPLVNYSWTVGTIIGIYTAVRVSTVLGKKIITFIVFWGATIYLLSGILDYIQCKYFGGGIGKECNGNWSLSASFCVYSVLFCLYFAEKYIWVVLYIVQGGYCFYTTTMDHTEPQWALLMFRVYGGTLFALVLVILIRYRIALVQAYNGILKHTTRIEQAWDRILQVDGQVLDDIAAKSRATTKKLKGTFLLVKQARPCWAPLTCWGAGVSRFSKKGKIVQKSRDIEEVYGLAETVSPCFQLFMKQWNVIGDLYSGTLKTSSRAIQKTVRSYDRDPSCLTDLVRCTIIVKTLTELNEWLGRLLEFSSVASHLNGWDEEQEEAEV